MKQLYNEVVQENTFQVWDFVLNKDWILIHNDYADIRFNNQPFISTIDNDWNIFLSMYICPF